MLQTVYLLTSSKEGISAHRFPRTLEISYKSAWFLMHRIREAMGDGDHAPFGGHGDFVEMDETFIGKKKGMEKKRAFHHKMKVLTLVDQDNGKARTMVIDDVKAQTLSHGLLPPWRVRREARIMTDEHNGSRGVKHWADARATARPATVVALSIVNLEDPTVLPTRVEGYFSIFKRGTKGVYQHCGEGHPARLSGLSSSSRYNNHALGHNDQDRAWNVIAVSSASASLTEGLLRRNEAKGSQAELVQLELPFDMT